MHCAQVCGDFEFVVIHGLDGFGAFSQGESRFEGFGLLHQIVDQIAGQNIWEPRNVVDGLFGINLCKLSAWLRQSINQMTAEFEQAGFKNGEQSYGTCADDDDICFDGLWG